MSAIIGAEEQGEMDRRGFLKFLSVAPVAAPMAAKALDAAPATMEIEVGSQVYSGYGTFRVIDTIRPEDILTCMDHNPLMRKLAAPVVHQRQPPDSGGE